MTDIKTQQCQKVLDKALETDDQKAIVAAYIDLGQAYLEIKDTPKGFTQFDQALKVAERAKDLKAETRLLGMIGICLKQLGNYGNAMQSFRKSLQTAKKIGDPLLEGDALYHIGALLVDQGEPLEAISHLDNALLLALQNQDHKRKLITTNLMGNIFLELESIDKAIENYATALDTARTLDDKQAEAASRVHLGQTFLLDEDFDAAIENFELGLAIADKMGLSSIELQALYGLTQACSGAGRTSLAVIYGEQVVNKAQQANAQAEEVQAIDTLAGIFAKNDQSSKAIPYFLRGIEIAQEKQDNDWKMKFLIDIGITYYLNDDFDNALTYMEKAYNTAVRFQQRQEEAFIAGRLAAIQADRGEYQPAIELNKRAIKLSEELDLPVLKGEQMALLAMNYHDQGKGDLANDTINQAIELYQELDLADMAEQAKALRESFDNA